VTASPRLLAVDLDGTLIRKGGEVAERDRRAIAALRERGITVVVATGRLYAGAREVMAELELSGLQICADGAHLVRHPRGDDVALRGLASAVDAMRTLFARGELALFALAKDRVVVDERSANLNRFVRHIAPDIERVERVLHHPSWDLEPGPSAVVAFGPVAGIDAVEPALREVDVDVMRYDVPGGFGVSSLAVHPRGASKGEGLRAVADALGVPMGQTVAVGDWLNDVSMLEVAGHSFAMRQAPAVVREAAQHALEATGEHGGGIAELSALLWGIDV